MENVKPTRPELQAAGGQVQVTGRRFYLPELDGIRFLAFLLVWFHHYPIDPRSLLGQAHWNGWIGVDVFLVLSSFLITSLLLLEFQVNEGISLSHFYSRRFLRIWPLLGLALFLNYIVLPAVNYLPAGFHNPSLLYDLRHHALPNLLLLGNWSVAIFGYLHYGYCNHLWTINLEEQFYLLWPALMTYLAIRSRRLVSCCLGLIAISYLARYYYASVGFQHPATWVSTITRIDPFAWGALLAAAYLRFNQQFAEKRRGVSVLLAVVFLCACILIFVLLRHWTWVVHVWWKLGLVDLLVAITVASVLGSSYLAFVFRIRPIAWLGRISYGLYVYHKFFAGSPMSSNLRRFGAQWGQGPESAWLLGMLLNGLALIATSALSYYCFERWFLKLKERFETILSRPA